MNNGAVAVNMARGHAHHGRRHADMVHVDGPAADDGRFQYLGGFAPLDEECDRRARRLGNAVGQALPKFVGYLGIDLVLCHHW